MSRESAFETVTSSAEQSHRDRHISDQSFKFVGPWFSSREAQAYVPCKTLSAWYRWRRRHGIVARANGSVAKADLDRVLRARKPKRVMHPASLANLQQERSR